MQKPDKPSLNVAWLMLMARRDSRRNRGRLLLFGSSIILGIAALVAVYSLGDNLRQNIDQQAATLIGADLKISGNAAPSAPLAKLMDSISRQKSEEVSLASMIYFPRSKGTRLVQVRALAGGFPYYGRLETTPQNAQASFRSHRAALVDQSVMIQYSAKVGDSIMVGNLAFVIEGILEKAPGQTGIAASVSPVVYIPLRYLKATGLLQKGSRINYHYFFSLRKQTDVEQLTNNIRGRLNLEGFDYDTIETQKESTGRSFEDLSEFLKLTGFVALILGCIGVSSAVHIYVREKIAMTAILRCLGAGSVQTFLIYLIQILGMGIASSVVGAIIGSIIQQGLPVLLKDLMPMELTTSISWPSTFQGIAVGIIMSVLVALAPLITVRKVSPLNSLRMSYQENSTARDPLKWLIRLLTVACVFVLTYLVFRSWMESAIFVFSVLAGFGLLSAIASALMWLVRRFFPSSASYMWRQGLSNLWRPNNQTLVLVVSIGFGTAFICTLFFVQSLLIGRIAATTGGDQPNIVLFDIQSQQREQVLKLAAEHQLPLTPTVPIVNMRLVQVNGMTAEKVQNDSSLARSQRLFSREYRVTYRDTLTAFEKITEGNWKGTPAEPNNTVYISIEKGFASRTNLEIGDTLVFNVQGVPVSTVIGSTREVDWNRIQTNFLVVFPKGVLENAPQFHVLLTKVSSPKASAVFQQDIVRKFPNVSIIDLGLIRRTIDEILEKIVFVIRFIAAFSIVTGLVVLIASVFISKFQRMRESVLLRTLGASGKQIFTITAIEYFFLGSLAAATGILLALAASWALAEFSFNTTFSPSLWPVIIIFVGVCVITVVIGLLNSRSVLRRTPLEVLRQEG